MDLYWGSGSPYAWRVMLGLLLKGLPYESHLLSFSDREHKQPGYTALNPRGRVPTLVDGDVVVRESLAILAYLDTAYPKAPLLGARRADVGRIWRKVLELDHLQTRAITPVTRALFTGRWTHDVPALRGFVTEIRGELALEEDDPEDGALNAVDCVLLPILRTLERASRRTGASEIGLLPFQVRDWPQLTARLEQLEAVEGFDRTWPPHWR